MALGVHTLTPDDADWSRRPATQAEMRSLSPALTWSVRRTLRRSGCSLVAVWHAVRAACTTGEVQRGYGFVVHAAREYQAYFDGRGGWSPYRAWRIAAKK